jgi:hypothetical protein
MKTFNADIRVQEAIALLTEIVQEIKSQTGETFASVRLEVRQHTSGEVKVRWDTYSPDRGWTDNLSSPDAVIAALCAVDLTRLFRENAAKLRKEADELEAKARAITAPEPPPAQLTEP